MEEATPAMRKCSPWALLLSSMSYYHQDGSGCRSGNKMGEVKLGLPSKGKRW